MVVSRKSDGKKSKVPNQKVKKVPVKLPSPVIVEEDESEDGDWVDEAKESEDEDESEDDGVDEEGMAKLMAALGDDGLDDIAQAQLNGLPGDQDGAEEDEDEEEGSEHEAEMLKQLSIEEDEESEDDAIPLDEISDLEVDEDAVPKQKVVINNQVCLLAFEYHTTS